jgi:cephalosporin hydroxylase
MAPRSTRCTYPGPVAADLPYYAASMLTAPPKLKSLARGVSKEARDVSTRRGGLGVRGAAEVLERTALRWPPAQRAITSAFHRLYYYNPSRTWTATEWLGHPIRKLPLDAWVYQEIIADVRPSLIIETGTRFGGSAQLMANICDLIGHGQVVSVDLAADAQPEHPRITYLDGSSVDPQIVAKVEAMVPGDESVLVVLDSDHRTEHVRQELAAYAKLVSVGSYLFITSRCQTGVRWPRSTSSWRAMEASNSIDPGNVTSSHTTQTAI